MKFIKIFISLYIFFLFLGHVSLANAGSLPVVTVINPIRYPKLQIENNHLPSLIDQWQVTHDLNINATWLWQYSTLEDSKLTDFAKSQMQNQEFGLFLEIDRNFSAKANVLYRGRGPWYFSDGLFLFSYDKIERQKLIDTAFRQFKDVFGYYPKTVGAWWIDAYSLEYMQKKYGIIASLRAADQFNLDAYSIWGTPWSIPYISSRENAGIPALSISDSSKVIIMQWAARDPVRGYGPSFENSTYSMQDFELKGYDSSYFKFLAENFFQKPLDQIVVGLENDFPAGSYKIGYGARLQAVDQLRKDGKINVLPAKDYAQEFLKQSRTIAPTNFFLTKDFETNDQAFWFNGINYRVGVEKINDKIFLVDLRDYTNKISEDFNNLPNSQGFLRISEPFIIDSARFPNQKLLIGISNNQLEIKEKDGNVNLFTKDKQIALFTPTSLKLLDLNSKVFNFVSHKENVEIFWILIFIFLLYSGIIFWYTRNILKTVLHEIFLILPLFLASSFLNFNEGFLFDKKELIFLLLPKFSNVDISNWLIILTIMPLLFLLIFHYLLIIKFYNKSKKLIYYFYLGLITFLYAHLFYFPLDKSTYSFIFIFLSCLIFILGTTDLLILYKTKKFKFFLVALSVSFLIFISIVFLILFSRQKYIITQFEIDALNFVKNNHKNVLYIYPQQTPIYKAVRPILYDYYQIGGKLTNVGWEKKVRNKVGFLDFTKLDNVLVFVPRYLGSDLSETEARENRLVKIFDNAQIEIYEKK